MISYQFNIINQFSITIDTSEKCTIAEYFQKELKSNKTKKNLIHVGRVNVVEKISISDTASVIIDGILYFQNKRLIYIYYNRLVEIVLFERHFEVTVEREFDPFKAFYITEVLVRLFAPLEGIVFLHASAFIYSGKTFVINAFGGTGKTNLLLDVLEKSGSYLSDDLVGIDTRGNLYPYQKRINMLYYNFQYKPHLLQKVNRPRCLLIILELLNKWRRRGLIYRLIVDKLEWRIRSRLHTYCDVHDLGFSGHDKRIEIDKFIWLERSNKETKRFSVDREYFCSRMKLCLKLESSHGLDLAGFLRLSSPTVEMLLREHDRLIDAIGQKHEIIGIMKKTGDEKNLLKMLREI